MSTFDSIHRLWASLTDLAMSCHCPSCGRRMALDEEPLCAQCMLRLPWENNYDWIYNPRMVAAADHPCLQRVGALMRYNHGNVAAKVVQSLKFNRNITLASWMGRLAVSRLRSTSLFDGIEALVPTPLSSRRQRLRGFNQALLLAQAMGDELRLPVCSDIVRKIKEVEPQTHLTTSQRLENLKGAYALTSNADSLRDKHIMLIDDVITTGSTFTSVISELEKVQGLRVSVFAWAWVT